MKYAGDNIAIPYIFVEENTYILSLDMVFAMIATASSLREYYGDITINYAIKNTLTTSYK